MSNRAVTTAALAAVLAAGAAPAAAGGKKAPKPKTRTVHVGTDYYDPAKLTIRAGDSVKWIWHGGFTLHDVVVEKGPEKFRSPTQQSGTYKRRLKKPGTYRLYCTQHEMEQTILVKRR